MRAINVLRYLKCSWAGHIRLGARHARAVITGQAGKADKPSASYEKVT